MDAWDAIVMYGVPMWAGTLNIAKNRKVMNGGKEWP